ncbi:MAG: efflux RND transporter periplasmic adaptor subunit [Thermodesulfobacteriota bacterium]
MIEDKKGGGRPLLYIILLIVGIGVGGAGGWFLFSKGKLPGAASPTTSTGNGVTMEKAGKKVKYWQAPMDPTYIRNEPGKSPMGMDLIPVYEGDDEQMEAGTVRIDPVTAQNIGVRVTKVAKQVLTKTIRTVGRVDYDEKRVHHVNTKIEGWVEKLYVDFTGEAVNKDDYLLEIYSPKLVATQEEYLLAKSYQEKAGVATGLPGGGSVLELARKRLELWDVPRHQIRELEESGVIKKSIHVHSPASGIVVKKNVKEGMYVKPGVNLYTIADLSKIWVYADIYEYEMEWVKLGQEAEMTLAAYPGRLFRGTVSFINPFMEPKTRTVKVRIEFDNRDGLLKPDMFANVSLKARRDNSSVTVPTEAVLLSGERSVVIVARGGGKFTPKEVTLGVEAGGYYEVIGGIEAGEEVVTSAHFLIDSESRLKEAISKMLELNKEDSGSTDMEGMDHSGMEGMDHSGMEGMDHGSMEHGEMDQ